jgi:hypothetical protein
MAPERVVAATDRCPHLEHRPPHTLLTSGCREGRGGERGSGEMRFLSIGWGNGDVLGEDGSTRRHQSYERQRQGTVRHGTE